METILLSIGEKEYNVSFPNVGQMMEIEAAKMALTNGKYIEFSMSMLKTHVYLLDVTDAVSYLSILIPDLKKDLGIANWRNVHPSKLKVIVKAYKEKFIPWYKEIFDDLYSYNEENKEKDGEQTKETSGEQDNSME